MTRLTAEEALKLSKTLSKKIRSKRKPVFHLTAPPVVVEYLSTGDPAFKSAAGAAEWKRQAGNKLDATGVGMNGTQFFHLTWEYYFKINAVKRWIQQAIQGHLFKPGKFILGLVLQPCPYCVTRNDFDDKHKLNICDSCDGSGCPMCRTYDRYKCNACKDFQELWVLPNGQRARMGELRPQIPLVGDTVGGVDKTMGRC